MLALVLFIVTVGTVLSILTPKTVSADTTPLLSIALNLIVSFLVAVNVIVPVLFAVVISLDVHAPFLYH